MQVIISVWQDEDYYMVGFIKGVAELVFDSDMDRDEVLKRAANVAIEFDLDLHVMGQLADAYEIRDTL